jgi:tetratricopeptide (TPR) repeat protein
MMTSNDLQQPTEQAPAAGTISEASAAAPTLKRLAIPWPIVLDRAMIALVIVLAFLSGCFVATNSDFFQHLAAGRLLAQGRYHFGEDPFSFAGEGAYWTNHSWLFDLAAYGVYSLPVVGGEVVVLLKALGIALLAWFLLLAGGKRGQGPWAPCACTALAVLVMSPRLSLHSSCLSYLFLAVTLWLLRQTEPGGEKPAGRRWLPSGWLLPVLMVLWVNVDAWFLLGPLAVALYLAGEIIEELAPTAAPKRTGLSERTRRLALVLPACLAACLINPHHVHAFQLPWELSLPPAAEALSGDYEFGALFLSPLDSRYLESPWLGQTVAGLAYFPLILLGLVSFALTWQQPRWSRVLLFLAFLALSLVNYRIIPFFAIVAGPIASLNYLDFLAGRSASRQGKPNTWLGPRVAAVLLGVVLLAVTAAGWLQANPASRQVGLGVRVDPALRGLALQLADWRRQGQLAPEDRLFNTTPDVAGYLAWFCPEQRNFLDLRLGLFAAAGRDFVNVRKALVDEPGAVGQEGRSSPAWRTVFPKWRIRYLVLHLRDPRGGPARAALKRLMSNVDGWPEEWSICRLDGRTVVARWNNREAGAEARPASPLVPALDEERLAFGSDADKAPSSGPAAPRLKPWWAALWQHEARRPLAGDEAYLHLFRSEVLSNRWSKRKLQDLHAWQAALATAIAGSTAPRGGPVVNGGLLLLHLDLPYRRLLGSEQQTEKAPLRPIDHFAAFLLNRYLAARETGLTAELYLALRAARRGVVENPNDAETYFVLARVYDHLARRSGELDGERLFAPLALTRQTQAMAAAQRALQCNPDHERAHALVVELCRKTIFLPNALGRTRQLLLRPNLELALRHQRELVRCAALTATGSNSADPLAQQRTQQLNKELTGLQQDVGKLRDEYELTTTGASGFVKAERALEAGLVETALAAFLEESQSESRFVRLAALRAAELLFSMGRLEEVSELLGAEMERIGGVLPEPLGWNAAVWYRLQTAAASGHYEEADRLLQGALGAPRPIRLTALGMSALTVGHLLLQEAPLAAGMPAQLLLRSPQLLRLPGRNEALRQASQGAFTVLDKEAAVLALRGCLALEWGATAEALDSFHTILVRAEARRGPRRTQPERAAPPERGRELPLAALPLARKYLRLLERNEPVSD